MTESILGRKRLPDGVLIELRAIGTDAQLDELSVYVRTLLDAADTVCEELRGRRAALQVLRRHGRPATAELAQLGLLVADELEARTPATCAECTALGCTGGDRCAATLCARTAERAPQLPSCTHAGATGPCAPRARDGRCVWCERVLFPQSHRTESAYDAIRRKLRDGGL